jgi:hypothetical protein
VPVVPIYLSMHKLDAFYIISIACIWKIMKFYLHFNNHKGDYIVKFGPLILLLLDLYINNIEMIFFFCVHI